MQAIFLRSIDRAVYDGGV